MCALWLNRGFLFLVWGFLFLVWGLVFWFGVWFRVWFLGWGFGLVFWFGVLAYNLHKPFINKYLKLKIPNISDLPQI
jgi:hypothetical protein